jgi:hypothetical protein
LSWAASARRAPSWWSFEDRHGKLLIFWGTTVCAGVTSIPQTAVTCGLSETTGIEAGYNFTFRWSFNVDPGSIGVPYSTSRVYPIFSVDRTPITYNFICRSWVAFEVDSVAMHAL